MYPANIRPWRLRPELRGGVSAHAVIVLRACGWVSQSAIRRSDVAAIGWPQGWAGPGIWAESRARSLSLAMPTPVPGG